MLCRSSPSPLSHFMRNELVKSLRRDASSSLTPSLCQDGAKLLPLAVLLIWEIANGNKER